MPRRRKKPSLSARLLTWGVVAVLLGWGIRQLVAVHAAIVQDIQQNGDEPMAGAPSAPLSINTDAATKDAAATSPPVEDAGDSVSSADAAAPLPPLPLLPAADTAPPTLAPVEALSTEDLAERGRQIDLLIEAADQALQSGRLVERRQNLNAALALIGESARAVEVRVALADLNTAVFLGPDVLPNDPYAPLISLEAGDTFLKIAQRYRITADLLAQLNPQLEPRSLRAGSGIKIVFGPFHARIVKHEARLDLFARDMYVRSYALHFDEGNFLPAGTYRVAPDGKIRVPASDASRPAHEWIQFQGAQAGNRAIENACFYGAAGPRSASAGLSGARLDDSDLHQLYNGLTESASLIQVDP